MLNVIVADPPRAGLDDLRPELSAVEYISHAEYARRAGEGG